MARRVPTTHGTRSSRLTIAAWQVMPPPSVTSAAARRMAGTQSGVVMRATRISPGCSSAAWATERQDPHGPGDQARRGAEALDQRLRQRAGPPSDRRTGDPSVVIGRDCTTAMAPSAIAHSMSWGSP